MAERLTRSWNVNGQPCTVRIDPLDRLLDVLRHELALTSVKEGCGEGECGACSILINGVLHPSCLVAAGQIEDGSSLITSEGLIQFPLGKRILQAFEAQGAVQCGYCIPGMLLASFALLSSNPHPDEDLIKREISGHLCRCTGYAAIIAAIRHASNAS